MINWIRGLLGFDATERRPERGRGDVRELATRLRKAPDPHSQEQTLDRLTALGTTDAQKALLDALYDPRLSRLQSQIVHRLSRFDIELARPALLTCLGDPDWFIRGVAADAIGEMTPTDAALTGTLVSVLWKASGSSTEALTRRLPPGVYSGAELLKVLENPASQEQFFLIGVIKALGKVREPSAAEPLRRIIAGGRSLHPDVLYNAERALASIDHS